MQPASHLRHPLKSRQIMVLGWLVEPEGDLRQRWVSPQLGGGGGSGFKPDLEGWGEV